MSTQSSQCSSFHLNSHYSAQILLHEPHAKIGDVNCQSARRTLAASRAIVELMHAITGTNYDVSLLDLQPFVSQTVVGMEVRI